MILDDDNPGNLRIQDLGTHVQMSQSAIDFPREGIRNWRPRNLSRSTFLGAVRADSSKMTVKTIATSKLRDECVWSGLVADLTNSVIKCAPILTVLTTERTPTLQRDVLRRWIPN